MKILLAEDDLHTREALVDILRGESFCVTSAIPARSTPCTVSATGFRSCSL